MAAEHRTALVTGASSGIGRATAEVLASRGWTVVGASRRGTAGSSSQLPWQGLVMDVDDDASVEAGVAAVLAEHGHVDALVAAAGWGLAGPVETTPHVQARAQVETLLWGVVRPTVALLPSMRERAAGRIVVVGSIGGVVALPFQAYYSAAKFAVEGWAEALAYEVAPFGVHVTVVEPGNVSTGFTDARRTADGDAGPYRGAADRAIDVMARDERGGVAPDVVAEVVRRQLDARRPRRRVSVGRAGERVGILAKRTLPHRWFETVAKGSLGLE